MCFCLCRLNQAVSLIGRSPGQNFQELCRIVELYWDFNKSIPRTLGSQEVPENGIIFTPKM